MDASPIRHKGTSSPWQDGVNLIDALVEPNNSRVTSALTQEEINGLINIRKLLISADIRENAIPADLLHGGGENTNMDLAEQFGGVKRKTDFRKTAKSVFNGLKFIKGAQSIALLKEKSMKMMTDNHKMYLPPEWNCLSAARQNYVYQFLTYEKLSDWNYDAMDLSLACGESSPLLLIGWAMLAAPHAQKTMALNLGLDEPEEDESVYEFVEEFNLKPEVLCNFLRAVESDYSKENAYHNSVHAADVAQTTFALLRMGGDKYATTPLETFSLICAAFCHDMGHEGKSNAYHVNSKSDLAVIYNGVSILENMHAARACRLLTSAPADMNLDILAGLSAQQQESFRALITQAILWTDMSHHFSKLAHIKSKISTHGRTAEAVKFYQNIEGRSMSTVLLFILHVADISNPAKPAPIFVEWCERSLNEFYEQGDAEKKAGLPVSPMCDRELTVKSDSQIGFIKYVVRPSFVTLSDLVPNVVDVILPLLESNLQYWEEGQGMDTEDEGSDEGASDVGSFDSEG
eukprot:g3565.t1 g3565   contig12:2331160-2332713(-)